MADGRIRTVQPNLINLKETVVNILHISSTFRRKFIEVVKKFENGLEISPSHLQTRRNKKVNHLITNYIWELIDGSIADLLSMSW